MNGPLRVASNCYVQDIFAENRTHYCIEALHFEGLFRCRLMIVRFCLPSFYWEQSNETVLPQT